jgi:hypothetical protein
MWYRLYELDDGDHVLKAHSLEFTGDAEAMAAARARAGVRALELWQGARRIGRIEPRRPEPASAQPSPA